MNILTITVKQGPLEIASVAVEAADDFTLEEAEKLLELEQFLNSRTRARFHIFVNRVHERGKVEK